jgi:hypothetical protein
MRLVPKYGRLSSYRCTLAAIAKDKAESAGTKARALRQLDFFMDQIPTKFALTAFPDSA